MAPAEPPAYRLSPRALADLEDIWRYTAATWSIEHADRYLDDLTRAFEAIARMPPLARERGDFTPPGHLEQPSFR